MHVCVVLQTVLSMEHIMATPILWRQLPNSKSPLSWLSLPLPMPSLAWVNPCSASDTSLYVLMSAFVTIILGECQQMNFKNCFRKNLTCEHFWDSINCGSVKKFCPVKKTPPYRTDCYMLCTHTHMKVERSPFNNIPWQVGSLSLHFPVALHVRDLFPTRL